MYLLGNYINVENIIFKAFCDLWDYISQICTVIIFLFDIFESVLCKNTNKEYSNYAVRQRKNKINILIDR